MKQSDRSAVPAWQVPATGLARWRQRLAELALACSGAFPGDEGQRLRDLRRLLADAPTAGLVRGLTVPEAAVFEHMIEAAACASAALALVGSECGYLLSRGAGGQHLASVILPDMADETSAGGDSLALALVGALALALAERADGWPVERRAPGRAARLN